MTYTSQPSIINIVHTFKVWYVGGERANVYFLALLGVAEFSTYENLKLPFSGAQTRFAF